jgi:hypothetical protein
VFQIINILFIGFLYVGILYAQFSFVERTLRTLKRYGRVARAGLSIIHAGIGYAFLLGVGLLMSVVFYDDYRRGFLGPYSYVLPIAGSLFGFLVPWLPLLRKFQTLKPPPNDYSKPPLPSPKPPLPSTGDDGS